MTFRWYRWTADEHRPTLLNRRALVCMVALVRIALSCFVQHEEKGALIWQIGRNAPVDTRTADRRAQRYRVDMGMTLNIPDSVAQAIRIPEAEIAARLRIELAIALYAQDFLSLGKAAELAETDRIAFGDLVGQRGIARHYGAADLDKDISHARG